MTHIAAGLALIIVALGANLAFPGEVDPALPVIFGLLMCISGGNHEDA